jgi:hypothetical protein
MRYKELNNKNIHPPLAMNFAVRSFRQLECLVRLRFAYYNKSINTGCEQTQRSEQRPTSFVGGCELNSKCAKWVNPPIKII